MLSSFQPGDRVRIQGLKSRPDLNDCVGVILGFNADEEQKLLSQGRVKVAVTLNHIPLSIKIENLKIVDYPVCWNLPMFDNKPLDLVEIIKIDPYGKIVAGEYFVEKIQKAIEGPQTLMPRELLHKESISSIINSVSDHNIYFMYLDQVMHYFVLETNEGKARVFQAYTRPPVVPDPRYPSVHVDRGYTCEDWTCKTAHAKLSETTRQSKARWGGGKELSHADLIKLAGTITTLQEQADEVAVAVMAKLPSLLEAKEPMAAWSEYLRETANVISEQSMPDGGLMIFSNAQYSFKKVPHVNIIVPARLVNKFSRTYKDITGNTPNGLVYLRTAQLRHYLYMKSVFRERTTDSPQVLEATGWSFHRVRLRNPSLLPSPTPSTSTSTSTPLPSKTPPAPRAASAIVSPAVKSQEDADDESMPALVQSDDEEEDEDGRGCGGRGGGDSDYEFSDESYYDDDDDDDDDYENDEDEDDMPPPLTAGGTG